jgi:hypothetical protein
MEGWKLIVTCGKESKIGWEVEKRRLVVRGKVEGDVKVCSVTFTCKS